MTEVVYEAPDSVEGAVTLLVNAAMPANVLAGGTDLIIQARGSKAPSRLFVDIKKIVGMNDAFLDRGRLRLGPSMSCAAFTARDDIKAVFPGLVEAAYLIGSAQVQGRASVGGNLCNASPAADTIPALIANAARCVIEGPAGERTLAVEDFVIGVRRNCMKKGELLKRIDVPAPAPNTADAYLRFIPRTEMDIAVAGAAVSVTLDGNGICTAARVAIGAVAPTPLPVPEAAAALVGGIFGEDSLQAAATAAARASSPINDRRGTVDFRKQVVGVLVKRAAAIAAERVKGG